MSPILINLFCYLQKRSRPPSFAGGDSPVLRSRSSTCDSIQSSSSPIANCPSRQFTMPMYQQSAGTSPKQQMSLGQYLGSAGNINAGVTNSTITGGGGSSPSSASSQSGRIGSRSNSEFVVGARKSTSTGSVLIFQSFARLFYFCLINRYSEHEFFKKAYSPSTSSRN